jgi:hypothetical protein
MPEQNDITLFARTNFRGKEVPFGIKRDDRRRHMYIIGKTGMGKTTLMENMIIQDIINGNGLAFVDPHGDSVEKILDYIPSSRVNDVVYFNPSDLTFPIAFNILESVDSQYKHLVASGLMAVFTKIWANTWSSRMEYILNNTILALLDSPGNTLLGISRIFLDKKYRKKIVDNIKDPVVRAFWMDEYPNWNDKYRMEAVAPIQNKVGQFLSSSLIRNIVGQPKSTIDLRQLMDDKKIILLNLSKGRMGEDNSALLGAMIITKLQLAALSRVDMAEKDRNDFYLYVDEFQNFATDSFATILSEARKYRLCLTVGHQYIGQLIEDRNTKVRDAVFGNVGTMISFRVGATDSEFLEKEFAPNFTENDLVNLPKYTILLKLMINGVASDPFTASALPPSYYEATGNAEKVIRVSRERYANPVQEVEQKILRWMGESEIHDEVAVIAKNVKGETQGDEDDDDQQGSANLPKAETADVPLEPTHESVAELQEKLSEPSPFNAVLAAQYPEPIPVEPLFKQAEPEPETVAEVVMPSVPMIPIIPVKAPIMQVDPVRIVPSAPLVHHEPVEPKPQPPAYQRPKLGQKNPQQQPQQPRRNNNNNNDHRSGQPRPNLHMSRNAAKRNNPIWDKVVTMNAPKPPIEKTINHLLTTAVRIPKKIIVQPGESHKIESI